jgi:hypothetical protein
MEGEGEPAETLKDDLERLAATMEQTGEWLAHAMEQSWRIAGALAAFPALADMLGERPRIIANDWQSASVQALIARLLRRGLDILGRVDAPLQDGGAPWPAAPRDSWSAWCLSRRGLAAGRPARRRPAPWLA